MAKHGQLPNGIAGASECSCTWCLLVSWAHQLYHIAGMFLHKLSISLLQATLIVSTNMILFAFNLKP